MVLHVRSMCDVQKALQRDIFNPVNSRAKGYSNEEDNESENDNDESKIDN